MFSIWRALRCGSYETIFADQHICRATFIWRSRRRIDTSVRLRVTSVRPFVVMQFTVAFVAFVCAAGALADSVPADVVARGRGHHVKRDVPASAAESANKNRRLCVYADADDGGKMVVCGDALPTAEALLAPGQTRSKSELFVGQQARDVVLIGGVGEAVGHNNDYAVGVGQPYAVGSAKAAAAAKIGLGVGQMREASARSCLGKKKGLVQQPISLYVQKEQQQVVQPPPNVHLHIQQQPLVYHQPAQMYHQPAQVYQQLPQVYQQPQTYVQPIQYQQYSEDNCYYSKSAADDYRPLMKTVETKHYLNDVPVFHRVEMTSPHLLEMAHKARFHRNFAAHHHYPRLIPYRSTLRNVDPANDAPGYVPSALMQVPTDEHVPYEKTAIDREYGTLAGYPDPMQTYGYVNAPHPDYFGMRSAEPDQPVVDQLQPGSNQYLNQPMNPIKQDLDTEKLPLMVNKSDLLAKDTTMTEQKIISVIPSKSMNRNISEKH